VSRQKLKPKEWARLLCYTAVYVLALFMLEYAFFERLVPIPEGQGDLMDRYFQYTAPAPPQINHTAILVLAPSDKEQKLSIGLCGFRSYMAKVLGGLSQLHPSGIIIDAGIQGSVRCEEADPALESELAKLCKEMPVVVGIEARNGHTASTLKTIPDVDVPTSQAVWHAGGGCFSGLMNMNADSRRVDLYADLGEDNPRETLAWTYVRITAPQLRADKNLQLGLTRGEDLYAHLIPSDQWKNDGLRVVSEDLFTPNFKETSAAAALHNHIVVIGSEEDPVEDTYTGPLFGYELQANAVEAILDHRLVPQLFGSTWQIIVALLLIAGIELLPAMPLISHLDWIIKLAISGVAWLLVIFVGFLLNRYAIASRAGFAAFQFLSFVGIAFWVVGQLHALLHDLLHLHKRRHRLPRAEHA
jgi:hypothetical protein